MKHDKLKLQTQESALRVIRLREVLPRSMAAEVFTRKVIHPATSIAANYRAARRTRSRRDFIARMDIVGKEADRTAPWTELIAQTRLLAATKTRAFQNETEALTAIAVASMRAARLHAGTPNSQLCAS